MNNPKNILLCIFLYMCVLISVGYLPRSGITESRVDVGRSISCLSNVSRAFRPVHPTASSSGESS